MFKKLFLFFVLLTTVVRSASGGTSYTIGTAGSTKIGEFTLTDRTSAHYRFTNSSNSTNFGDKWRVYFTTANETWGIQADSWIDGKTWPDFSNQGRPGMTVTPQGDGPGMFTFSTFNDDMNGSIVDLYITLNGNELKMTSVILCSTGKTYLYTYTFDQAVTGNVPVYLTGNNCTLDVEIAELLTDGSYYANIATLNHTASTWQTSNQTNHYSVDGSGSTDNLTETYGRKTSNDNQQGYAFADFSYSIPSGHTFVSAALNWAVTNIHYNGNNDDRKHYIDYLNAGTTLDYNAISNGSSGLLRYVNSTTNIASVTTVPSVTTLQKRSDVTSAVETLLNANQNQYIFQWSLEQANYADLYSSQSIYKPALEIVTRIPAVYFENAENLTARIQDYNLFQEPTLHYPIGSNVTYSVSDPKKAVIINGNQVVFRNTGYVTINATVTYTVNGTPTTTTASYTVFVTADDVIPLVDQATNTCTLSGEGRLSTQNVILKGLSMNFGNIDMPDPNKNVTIVQTKDNELAASTIAQNGFRFTWWGDGTVATNYTPSGVPYQGSFYKFMPTISGRLTVRARKEGNGNVKFIEETNPSTNMMGSQTINNGQWVDLTFDLVAGRTYYFCVEDNNSYTTLYLNQFSYDADYYFYKDDISNIIEYDVTSTGASTYSINLEGVVSSEPVVFNNGDDEMECYGNITNATVTYSNGVVTIGSITYKNGISDSQKGGAIVIHAYNAGRTQTFVLTVAYQQNLWDFTLTYNLNESGSEHGTPKNPANILTDLKGNNTDWAVTYKVRTYVNSQLTYLNAPVYSNATRVDGNNADYNKLTAGLLITAAEKSFGSNTVLPSDYYSDNVIKTEKLYDALNFDASTLSSDNQSRAEILTLYYGSELTIPYLKAGDYVRMKWKSYDNNKGDKIELTNLTDLEGKDMEYIFASSIRDGEKNNGEGYHVFKVKESKDVKFRVGDSGWLNIYSIQVTHPTDEAIDGFTTFKDDHSYNDKINSYSKAMDTNLSKPKTDAPIDYISGQTAKWANTGGSVRGQQNVAIEYSLEGLDGGSISSTLAGTEISEQGQLIVNGHGQCVVVSKGFTVLGHVKNDEGYKVYDRTLFPDRYYVDLERTLITVNENGTVEQNYPYTWNFTDLSDDTKNKLNTDQTNWSNNNGTFTPTDAYQDAFVTGSGISYVNSNSNKKDIKEYKGFGINTHVDKGYSTDLKKISVTSDGLVVGESTAQSTSPTFTIPAVPSEQTVYVRYSGDGTVTLTNGEGVNDSGSRDVTGDKVCYVVGTGSKNDNTAGDVIITASNVTIKAIGVTDLKKEGRFRSSDGLYYNSECQSYDINYDYTEDFTGTKMGAYLVVLANAENNTVTTEDIKIVPASIGSIIYTTDEQVDHHIFVPSVNQAVTQEQKEDAIHSSILTGVVIPTDLPASNSSTNYYVFTNIWGYVKGNDKSDTNSQTASIPGFFRVNSAGTLNAHRAYLAVAVSASNNTSPVKAYTLFPWNGDFVDAIEAVPTTETESNIDMNGTFYTLQGTKIEGMPKQGGIYIQNGKKIFVK